MSSIRIPMDMYNTFRECAEGYEGAAYNVDAKVHPFMRPLFEALSRARPDWQFISASGSTSGAYEYADFRVEVAGEVIGNISTSHNWRTGVRSYDFDCKDLRAKRERGNVNSTKDLKKATKLILGSFRALTPAEHIQIAFSSVSSHVTAKTANARYAVDRAVNVLKPSLIGFIRDNYEAFTATLTYKADKKASAEILPDYAAYVEYDTVSSAFANKVGAVVKLLGSKYIVRWLAEDVVDVYVTHTLPDCIKAQVGMLKLAADKQVVPGIGARGTDGALYIMDCKRPVQVSDEQLP